MSARIGAVDAFLVVSFGGPEGPDDVVPFLENVTRGRGIPRERLVEVGAHYAHFGGVSPINALNRDLVQAIRSELAARGHDVPVLWGNRNWDPFLAGALAEARDLGVTRVFSFLTSAYSSYSGCRQYRENLFDALSEVQSRSADPDPAASWAPEVHKLRTYFNHPEFLAAMTDATRRSLAGLPEGSRLVFTTHSIPMADAQQCDYVAQHEDVAATIADALGRGSESRIGPGSGRARHGHADGPGDVGGDGVEVPDDLHVVADEPDGHHHSARGTRMGQCLEVVTDVGLQPRNVRGTGT